MTVNTIILIANDQPIVTTAQNKYAPSARNKVYVFAYLTIN
jgi:hypothetical protein